MHIPPPAEPTPLVSIIQGSMMAMQNNSHPSANGDDDIGVGNKLNFYPAVDEDYETRRAEQQAESLIPLKEDLAEWIQRLLDIPITTETFLPALDNGAALCRLAFLIQSKAEEASREGKFSETIPRLRFRCRENAKSRTWYARDNTANFLRWCRDFGINEGCMFESEDLVCHRQEKPVVVCLLELARLGYRFGLEPPSIVKIEKEIEREESELASQVNDDDPNEAADEAAEGGDEVETEAGSEVENTKEENDDEEEEKDDNEEDQEKEEVEGEEEEEEEEEEKEENSDENENKSIDGVNGNANDDAVSEGHKSRATSHVSSQIENEENGEVDNEGEEEEGEDDEEKEESDKEKEEESEGVNGTVNGTGEDENGNDEDKDSSSETKGVDTRPNSPTKNDSGTTSPSRKSPTSPRSRIDNIKARQLDKKVKHVASEHNVSEHVNQISEGKYCIFGRVVFIRLLKEKHLMVRVGGGWDTLDHYLSHHSPTKILEFKRNDQTKTPAPSPRHDPDTGETAASTSNTADEKYLVISGKYKRN